MAGPGFNPGDPANDDESYLNGSNHLYTLVLPAVQTAGYRLVRLRLMGGKRKTLQIMAERADGQMDVEDCAKLSRLISEVLEAADPITDEYVLEVSSPGIDRPLTVPEDFARFAGYEARVELARGLEGRRRFKGFLRGLDGRDVLMDVPDEVNTQRVRFPYGDVTEAKLLLTDRLIQESLKARELRDAKVSHLEGTNQPLPASPDLSGRSGDTPHKRGRDRRENGVSDYGNRN